MKNKLKEVDVFLVLFLKKIVLILMLSFTIILIIFYFNSNQIKVKGKSVKSKNVYSIKVGLCIICKKENLYIKEFIEHYKNLGYNHIFIYDNNNINGEKLEGILRNYIDNGFVSIINYRGIKNKPQFRVYIDCYEKNNKNYDWLSFFDVDEFLVLKPKGINIKVFLNNERYKNCQNVKFNWLLYSDDNKLNYNKKPIQKRFTTPLFNNILNKHVKSTVRGNLSINYWKESWNPHSGITNYNCCSSSGKQISKISPYNKPYDYKYGYLKHYRTKTIEEYINKIKRGRADYIGINYKDMIKKFFMTNKKTKKKIDIFKKELNVSLK